MTRPAPQAVGPSAADVAIRFALVGLTFATAYIHLTLGGLMFLANAAGFATLGVAMIVPVGFPVRYRGLIQLALGAFAAATIGGWALFGARYSTGYVATGIEIALVVLVAIARFVAARDSGPPSAGTPA